MVGVVVPAAAALAAGYLLGRLRPWRSLGDWAADQAHFTGTRGCGGTCEGTVADAIAAKLDKVSPLCSSIWRSLV